MSKKTNWPFRHLRRESSWPMQGIVVAFAAAVLQTPAPERAAAGAKMLERSFRLGARLARELEADPVEMLRLAQRQLEREIPGAKEAIAEARAAELELANAAARAAVEKMKQG